MITLLNLNNAADLALPPITKTLTDSPGESSIYCYAIYYSYFHNDLEYISTLLFLQWVRCTPVPA